MIIVEDTLATQAAQATRVMMRTRLYLCMLRRPESTLTSQGMNIPHIHITQYFPSNTSGSFVIRSQSMSILQSFVSTL